MKKKHILIIIVMLLIFNIGLGYFIFFPKDASKPFLTPNQALAAQFDYLNKNGNSNCSTVFRDSISSMPDDGFIRGSCCAPMSMHRYSEQVEGLKKYKNITEIPSDPYNIKVSTAKKMVLYYDETLNSEQQKAYDYAMNNSKNKGPCCCKCWRWNFYGGLAKYLIINYNFTGEQITEVWNFSDGCGGEGEHVYHK